MKKELQSEASGRERRGYSRGVAGFIRRQDSIQNTFELCSINTAKKKLPVPTGSVRTGSFFWRMGWDSNPRGAFAPASLAARYFHYQLSHPSCIWHFIKFSERERAE